MTTTFLDPNGASSVANWNNNTNVHLAWDDAVRSPANASSGGDGQSRETTSGGSFSTATLDFGTATVGTVSGVKVWVYMSGGQWDTNGVLELTLILGGSNVQGPTNVSVFVGGVVGWKSITYTPGGGGPSQGDIDGLQVRIRATSAVQDETGELRAVVVYAVYVEVTHDGSGEEEPPPDPARRGLVVTGFHEEWPGFVATGRRAGAVTEPPEAPSPARRGVVVQGPAADALAFVTRARLVRSALAPAGPRRGVLILALAEPPLPHQPRAPRLPIDWAKRYHLARGLYRVFGEACYRLYWSDVAPPAEGDTPQATSASLPATPADTFADGTYYLSLSYFNGVIDSGFLPVGPQGETFLVLTIDGGEAADAAPLAPLDVRLERRPGGVVRVVALYLETDPVRRGTLWAVAYTTNGSTPPEDTPTTTKAFLGLAGVEALALDLPSQAHGTEVKVRTQVRRGASAYSDGSVVLSVVVDTQGPAAPDVLTTWRGPLPEEL